MTDPFALVLYDGECSFCTRGVSRLNRLDGGNRLAFVSLHDPLVAERYPDLSHDRGGLARGRLAELPSAIFALR